MLKQKIYDHYLQVINDKINLLKQTLADLKESSANETKSTAGDKHETALAMLQIEQANTSAQLQDALEKKTSLQKINLSSPVNKIIPGSLIKTNQGYLFMSVALGKALIDGKTILALSPQSPLGIRLSGLRPGDTAVINDHQYLVEEIE